MAKMKILGCNEAIEVISSSLVEKEPLLDLHSIKVSDTMSINR